MLWTYFSIPDCKTNNKLLAATFSRCVDWFYVCRFSRTHLNFTWGNKGATGCSNPAANQRTQYPYSKERSWDTLHFQVSSACAIHRFHGMKFPATTDQPGRWWASIGKGGDMDPFKVTVESLHANRIKEINYEGEESFQEWERPWKIPYCRNLWMPFILIKETDCFSKNEGSGTTSGLQWGGW